MTLRQKQMELIRGIKNISDLEKQVSDANAKLHRLKLDLANEHCVNHYANVYEYMNKELSRITVELETANSKGEE